MGFGLLSLTLVGLVALAKLTMDRSNMVVAESKEEARKIMEKGNVEGNHVVAVTYGNNTIYAVTDTVEAPALRSAMVNLKGGDFIAKHDRLMDEIKALSTLTGGSLKPSDVKKAIAQAKGAVKGDEIDFAKIQVKEVIDKVANMSATNETEKKQTEFLGWVLGKVCDYVADTAKSVRDRWNDIWIANTKSAIEQELRKLKAQQSHGAAKDVAEPKIYKVEQGGKDIFIGAPATSSIEDVRALVTSDTASAASGSVEGKLRNRKNVHCGIDAKEVKAASLAVGQALDKGELDLSGVTVTQIK